MGLQLFPPSRVMGSNEHTTVQTSPTEPSSSSEFTTFMRAYQDMVFSTAARLAGNDVQAQDIAQDVFIKAYENFEHLRTSPAAGGWLKTVATNLSLFDALKIDAVAFSAPWHCTVPHKMMK